jgi:hypothetical protein
MNPSVTWTTHSTADGDKPHCLISIRASEEATKNAENLSVDWEGPVAPHGGPRRGSPATAAPPSPRALAAR